MISIDGYVRRGRRWVYRWAGDRRVHGAARALGWLAAGFLLSAAGVDNRPLPLAASLVCVCSGWSAVLTAAGGALGYWLFWGSAALQPVAWVGVGLLVAVLLVDRRISRQTPLLLPAVAALIVATWGLIFQMGLGIGAPVPIYVLQVLCAGSVAWLFAGALRGRDPLRDWLVSAVAVLALAQIMPIPYLGLGYIAAGALCVAGAFPAAALAGLALDLAGITPVPMTAVTALAYLVRLLPRYAGALSRLAPMSACVLVMYATGTWDLLPLPGLLLGGLVARFLPRTGNATHRRGETGVAQVRLEVVAGVLAQTEQLLLEIRPVPVDEEALVCRAAEQACAGCPCRNNCPDSRRIRQLPGPILQKPLVSQEELPIVCRKSGRFLAQLHRSQEQLRSIRADRERQREYREAVIQQYRFLSEYLQELADGLTRRADTLHSAYRPRVAVCGNRPEADNGDRCLCFPGTLCRYYVLLCDGMGTGLGAVREGKTAGALLKRLLGAGFPAEHALRSLNSLCALRERAGAVTVDLAELDLSSGRVKLYKWGAAASYLVSDTVTRKLGAVSAPPGLGVDQQELTHRLTLRRGEVLVLVSDGIEEQTAQASCRQSQGQPPQELARQLLEAVHAGGQDDATVMAVDLV